MLNSTSEIGAGGFRLKGEELTDDAQDVAVAACGIELELFLIRVEKKADFVFIQSRGEGEDCGDFCGELGLGDGAGSEFARSGSVDEEEDVLLALLGEELDVGGAETCGDVPIDGAHFIALLIFADFCEFNSTTFERSLPGSGGTVLDDAARADLNPTHFFHQFGSEHHLRSNESIENLRDEGIGIHVFGLSLVGWDDAVTEDIDGDRFDIFRENVVAPIQEREAAGATGEL